MKATPFATSAILALIMAVGLSIRLFFQQEGFQHIVNESLASSEGYDQKFIDLVDHLEDVLTTRASFPFMGGKDPMTGRRREIASSVVVEEPQKRKVVPKAPNPKGPETPAPKVDAPPAAPEDHVKLTAIIADDYGQHTAIVMDGERSMSVDVGDAVGNRKVTRISAKEIVMEDDSIVYTYGIAGNRTQQPK
jgi:hypothetical protein